ncbi:MAG: hypothetical protein D6689_06540 [Deltaproteobacteria bacterium]|nr:MAG: hypothetical protein D6689_06540 [Deltaproteobacteria bacterium]
MSDTLAHVYGSLLVVRPPVPATVNKAGANYKSEVTHLEYSPRAAYDEWLSICEGIRACGGDALFDFEEADQPLLDVGDLEVDGDGAIHPVGSRDVLGHLDDVLTGRVFTANGPWVTVRDRTVQAVLPHMLAHRRPELPYYRALLERIADAGGYDLELIDNPHKWEGMADVAVVADKVILTYTVEGHYDAGVGPKTMRSSREGVAFAADRAGVPDGARIYAELVYPHFHGDTVHFGARPTNRGPVLMQYAGGLYGDGAARIAAAIGEANVVPITRADAVDAYAANSRQVLDGVLVPDGVSRGFLDSIAALGLTAHPVALYELFGKAGGGPACATLYLPTNVAVADTFPLRYSVRRDEAHARRERIPARLTVAPEYFEGKPRG